MGLLFDAIILSCLLQKTNITFKPMGKIYGLSDSIKPQIFLFSPFLAKTWLLSATTTFEMNGHGASMWCCYIVMFITKNYFIISIYGKYINYIVGFTDMIKPQISWFSPFLAKNWQLSAAPTFEINSHGVSMWCHCFSMLMKRKIHNIWTHGKIYLGPLI